MNLGFYVWYLIHFLGEVITTSKELQALEVSNQVTLICFCLRVGQEELSFYFPFFFYFYVCLSQEVEKVKLECKEGEK